MYGIIRGLHFSRHMDRPRGWKLLSYVPKFSTQEGLRGTLGLPRDCSAGPVTKRNDLRRLLSFHSLIFSTSPPSSLVPNPTFQQKTLHSLHSFIHILHSLSKSHSPAKHSSLPSFIHILHFQSQPLSLGLPLVLPPLRNIDGVGMRTAGRLSRNLPFRLGFQVGMRIAGRLSGGLNEWTWWWGWCGCGGGEGDEGTNLVKGVLRVWRGCHSVAGLVVQMPFQMPPCGWVK